MPGGASFNTIRIPAGERSATLKILITDDDYPSIDSSFGIASDGPFLSYPEPPDSPYQPFFTLYDDDKVEVDLYVDSNNEGPIDPDNSEAGTDDPIEEATDRTGLVVFANVLSLDNDFANGHAIPGFADGFNRDGFEDATYFDPQRPFWQSRDDVDGYGSFDLVRVTLPKGFDPSIGTLAFSYSGSRPLGVSYDSATDVYAPASGALRLWTAPKGVVRLATEVAATPAGHYVAPLTPYRANAFTMVGDSIYLFVEGVRASAQAGDQVITVYYDPDGNAGVVGTLTDTVRITVVEADLDITRDASGVAIPDPLEATRAGRINLNNDDDDNNGMPDFLDGAAGAAEDDLATVVLRPLLPGILGSRASSPFDGTFTITFDSAMLKAWRDPQKSVAVVSGTAVDPLVEHTLFVEAISYGVASIDVKYTDGFVRGSDIIQFSSVVGNLTAYRPFQSAGSYVPFDKTAVAADDEDDLRLGPGIRINGDDDNGNQVRDYADLGGVTGEDDLIEVRVGGLPQGYNGFVLERSSEMKVWLSPDKTGQVVFANDGLRSDYLSFGSGTGVTIYVEWASLSHGAGVLKLIDAVSDTTVDSLAFHTFHSVLIGFSGETFGAFVGVTFVYDQQPPFDIAKELYDSGYDSRYYDVWNHTYTPNGFSGPAVDEGRSAVSRRNVRNVAIYGWSHGGGATALLARELELGKGRGVVPDTFEIAATAYIDAVRYDGVAPTVDWLSENRRPLADLGIVRPHANWYQTTVGIPIFWHGASVPESVIDENLDLEMVEPEIPDHLEIAMKVRDEKLVSEFFFGVVSDR